jgi:excisionase family DNA binding protein
MMHLFELLKPEALARVPREQIGPLLLQLASAQSVLAASLINEPEAPETSHRSPEFDGLITVEEAARKLNLTEQYVYGLLKAGKIPPVKCGKYVRIRPCDLNAWIEKHTEKPIDNGLYVRYSRGHGSNQTVKNQKITGIHSRTDG